MKKTGQRRAIARAFLVTFAPFTLAPSLAGAMSQEADQAAAARAETFIDNPRGIIRNFDADNIASVLTDLGIVWQARRSPEGRSFVAASMGANLSFNIYPSACLGADGRSDCVGAHYVALFKGIEPNRQTVTAFNQAFPFTSAGITQNGGAYISRYEIADFGIARGNFASSLASFLFLAERFEQEIATARQTVALEGTPEDMAARFLNGRSAGALGVSPPAAGTFIGASHQRAFDETVHVIRVLEAQDGAPKNKIRNLTE